VDFKRFHPKLFPTKWALFKQPTACLQKVYNFYNVIKSFKSSSVYMFGHGDHDECEIDKSRWYVYTCL